MLPLRIPDIAALALPLRLLPVRFHSGALALAMNQVMSCALADGELDFLAGRRLEIRIEDLGVRYCLGLSGRQLTGFGTESAADASISGDLRELLLLAARREDADTLFFQRRLRMSGDTELGLYVKNFLDSFEPPERWRPLVQALDQVARWAETDRTPSATMG